MGDIFIILIGLFGVLVLIAGFSMLLGSGGNIIGIALSIAPILIGGAIVYWAFKSQKKE
jgi:hypothetical protein